MRREAARGCKLVERGHLCFTAQYGQSHLTGQRVIRLQQPVGPVAIKPKRAGNLGCEVRKAAADKIRIGAIRFHRCQKLRATGHIGDACLIDFVDDLNRQTLEQPGALLQGLFEIQFAIHRSCGDL